MNTTIKLAKGRTVKVSRITSNERMAREKVLLKRLRVAAETCQDHKYDLLVMPYGGAPRTELGRLLRSSFIAMCQAEMMAYTTKGDFSHLHTGCHEVSF